MRALWISLLFIASGCTAFKNDMQNLPWRLGLASQPATPMARLLNAQKHQDWDTFCEIAASNSWQNTHFMYGMGYCYQHGYGLFPENRVQSVQWYTLAARYDHHGAKNALIMMSEAVPDPDLARHLAVERQAAAEAFGKALQGGVDAFVSTQKPKPIMLQQPRNCTTYDVGGGIMHTHCY